MENAIETRNLSKSFGQVHSCIRINLTVRKGEILALLGENGSGKSTLVNMISGIYSPDSGEVIINGRERQINSPSVAFRYGIGMVHQHFMLVSVMSAIENITLGDRETGTFFIHKGRIKEKVTRIMREFGFEIDLEKKIFDMSISEKQTVEILKVLYRSISSFTRKTNEKGSVSGDKPILILDEPTAVLVPSEVRRLFSILKKMKESGFSVIIITHKLNEVLEISDRVSVLHKGRLVRTLETKLTNTVELAALVIGGEAGSEAIASVKVAGAEKHSSASSDPILEARNLTFINKMGLKTLNNVSFNLHSGEILGVAGVVDSGQKELTEVLTGLLAARGSATFMGQELLKMTPIEIKKLGIRMNFVPEDRLGMGLIPNMDITNNIILRTYSRTHGPLIDRRAGDKKALNVVEKYKVTASSIHGKVSNLSGGNIQKILLAREIEMNPRLLIIAYPFRGLDIGATNTIMNILNAEKEKGVAILLIAEDIDQLLSISDRIMVIHNGKVMKIDSAKNLDKEKIGLLMME